MFVALLRLSLAEPPALAAPGGQGLAAPAAPAAPGGQRQGRRGIPIHMNIRPDGGEPGSDPPNPRPANVNGSSISISINVTVALLFSNGAEVSVSEGKLVAATRLAGIIVEKYLWI